MNTSIQPTPADRRIAESIAHYIGTDDPIYVEEIVSELATKIAEHVHWACEEEVRQAINEFYRPFDDSIDEITLERLNREIALIAEIEKGTESIS